MKIVRYVGDDRCPSKEYADSLTDDNVILVDSLVPGPNTTVTFKLDGKLVELRLASDVRDLLDLSISVYIADEHIERESQSDRWTRNLEFLLPVRHPDVWEGGKDLLIEALGFLSGDRYSFSWVGRSRLPIYGSHRLTLPRHFDTVCLFSGGMDSLFGAYELLQEGRKVLLVGHQADNIAASAQKEIASWLRGKFGNSVSLLQCRAARSHVKDPPYALPKKNEVSHRVRSFLFICLAASIAATIGVDSIIVPENGLIALNIPLQVSRIGSLSTRTAHPIYLSGMTKLLSQLGILNGAVRNPFLYESKADLAAKLDDSLREIIRNTVSCAHPGRVQEPGKRHCGYCLPCLYRRDTLIEAGLDYPSDDYAIDVFRDLPSLLHTSSFSTKSSDFRALVSFAGRVVEATEAQRQMMILAHGSFPSGIGAIIGPYAAKDYSPWSGMLLRWAEGFLDKTNSLCSSRTKQLLGI